MSNSIPKVGAIPLGTLVLVVWYDAWGDDQQMGQHDWKDEMKVETVGFLERDTERILTLCSERFPDDPGQFRGSTHVPRGIVESITILQEEG